MLFPKRPSLRDVLTKRSSPTRLAMNPKNELHIDWKCEETRLHVSVGTKSGIEQAKPTSFAEKKKIFESIKHTKRWQSFEPSHRSIEQALAIAWCRGSLMHTNVRSTLPSSRSYNALGFSLIITTLSFGGCKFACALAAFLIWNFQIEIFG